MSKCRKLTTIKTFFIGNFLQKLKKNIKGKQALYQNGILKFVT